ncbi:MAG: PKD domain-containing protein [Candidatus Paceibacterota bacterium]
MNKIFKKNFNNEFLKTVFVLGLVIIFAASSNTVNAQEYYDYSYYGGYTDYSDYGGYSDYSDYGSYTDYSDYSGYSDYSDYGGYTDYSDYGGYTDYSDYSGYTDYSNYDNSVYTDYSNYSDDLSSYYDNLNSQYGYTDYSDYGDYTGYTDYSDYGYTDYSDYGYDSYGSGYSYDFDSYYDDFNDQYCSSCSSSYSQPYYSTGSISLPFLSNYSNSRNSNGGSNVVTNRTTGGNTTAVATNNNNVVVANNPTNTNNNNSNASIVLAFNTPNYVNPAPTPLPSLLQASCYANPFTVNVGNTVVWNGSASGGTGNYTYYWSGDDSLYGYGSSLSKQYGTYGTKNATLTISDGNQTVTRTCSVYVQQQYYTDQTLNGSCSASNSNPNINENVTWNAAAYGGAGNYSYYWYGTDNLSGSGSSITKSYPTYGTKTATLVITSGNQSITRTCYTNINTNQSTVLYQQPSSSQFVSLSQVPYTGLEDNIKTGLFMAMLALWSAIIAYVIYRKKVGKNTLATNIGEVPTKNATPIFNSVWEKISYNKENRE